MEYASKGVAGAALGTGIGGLALGVLNGGLGNLLGGGGGMNYGGGCGMNYVGCHENMPINRYEAGQSARIAELETEVKLRDANFYTSTEMGKLRDYVDGRLSRLENELCRQAVVNQKTEDSFLLLQSDLRRERDERCCGDNAIINYSNATFYPKMVADVTTGTTTTAQLLYNPLPNCGCCGK